MDTIKKKCISKRHCSLLEKPQIRKRNCNNFPCKYHWKTEPWEYCSQTCGLKGEQQREVHCVLTNSSGITVQPSLCSSEKPSVKQPCNIESCPGNWEIEEWSVCSVTCGEGTHSRKVTCKPPRNEVTYNCGKKPAAVKPCENQPSCSERCVYDKSPICENAELSRYCIVHQYFEHCCKTCDKYINHPTK